MSTTRIYNQNNQIRTVEKDNLLQMFDFGGNKVRTVTDEDGELWFVAKDIAKVLGYRSASNATMWLDEDEKGIYITQTSVGQQKLIIIKESGLYSLIFSSRKAKAKKFKKWVTSEMLSTIRKTGGYSQQIDFSNTKQVHELLLKFSKGEESEQESEINVLL
jgi:prophage antirepressor-like protein